MEWGEDPNDSEEDKGYRNKSTGKAHGTIAPYKISKPEKRYSGIRFSNFMITISTNYRPKNQEDYQRVAQKLEGLLYQIFNPQDMDRYCFDFKEPHQNDEWKVPAIKSAEAKWGIELGHHPKGGRVHAHVLVEVVHQSKIWANGFRIKQLIDVMMAPEVRGSKVQVKLVPNDIKRVLSYIRKDQDLGEDELIRAFQELNM